MQLGVCVSAVQKLFYAFFNFVVDPCESISCLNGGTCILTPESYNDTSDPCICQERFIGRYCDTYLAGKDINYSDPEYFRVRVIYSKNPEI